MGATVRRPPRASAALLGATIAVGGAIGFVAGLGVAMIWFGVCVGDAACTTGATPRVAVAIVAIGTVVGIAAGAVLAGVAYRRGWAATDPVRPPRSAAPRR